MPVIEILVKAGDTVEAEQPIVTLESDKASMDVPSPAAGKITEIVVKVGDKVSMGSLVAKLDAGGQAGQIASDQEDEADAKEEEDAAEAPDTSPVAPRDLPPRPPKAGWARASPISPGSTPVPRFGGWRVNSAWISIRSRGRAKKAASPART